MMTASVTPIRPKTLNKVYKKQSYTITFDMETKMWKWEVVHIVETKMSGTAKTIPAANKAAEKHIDKYLEMRGGA